MQNFSLVKFLCPFNCWGIWLKYLVGLLCGDSEKASKQCREKRGLSAAIESKFSAKEKGMKKDKIRKNATTKRKKVSNQQKITMANVFRKILQQLVKTNFNKSSNNLAYATKSTDWLFSIFTSAVSYATYTSRPNTTQSVFCPTSKHSVTYNDTTPEPCFSANEVGLKHVHLSIWIGSAAR